jgi:hypothetical protein
MRVTHSQADYCPHCGNPFQIVRVRFRFNGAATESVCPNCAIPSAEPEILANGEQSGRIKQYVWRGLARMDSLDLRVRRIVAFIIGAVIVAGILRHAFHVYGGYSRPEIAMGALIAVPAVVLVIILLRKKR